MKGRKVKHLFWGLAPVGEGRAKEKGEMRVNMVDIFCIHT
jgi:hypothetical protein